MKRNNTLHNDPKAKPVNVVVTLRYFNTEHKSLSLLDAAAVHHLNLVEYRSIYAYREDLNKLSKMNGAIPIITIEGAYESLLDSESPLRDAFIYQALFKGHNVDPDIIDIGLDVGIALENITSAFVCRGTSYTDLSKHLLKELEGSATPKDILLALLNDDSVANENTRLLANQIKHRDEFACYDGCFWLAQYVGA